MLTKQALRNKTKLQASSSSSTLLLRQAIIESNSSYTQNCRLLQQTQLSTDIFANLRRLFATNEGSSGSSSSRKRDPNRNREASAEFDRASQNAIRSHDQNDKRQFRPRYETKESLAMRNKMQQQKEQEEQADLESQQQQTSTTDGINAAGSIDQQQQQAQDGGSRLGEEISQLDRLRIYQETDISTEAFKNQLREFCHYYQIPYLENNVAKSCINAAKILYRMLDDQKHPAQRFQTIKDYLLSIPKEEIDDAFNPYKIKEKWMKFFRSGTQRIVVDADRALKNEINESLRTFIYDQKSSFNDKQLVKAILITAKTMDHRIIKDKDRMIQNLLSNILIGKFEFKKGNTLASLAEALTNTFDSMFPGITDPAKQMYIGEDVYIPPTEIMSQGTHVMGQEWYFKMVKACQKLAPFYQYYFDYYLPQKKVVVMQMYTFLRVYDEYLFSNLAKTIDQVVSNILDQDQILSRTTTITPQSKQNPSSTLFNKQQSTTKSDPAHLKDLQNQSSNINSATTMKQQYSEQFLQTLEQSLHQVCSTQNPIHNNEVDRFNEMMRALEFHAKELKNRKGIDICASFDGIKRETIDKLLIVALRKLKKEKLHMLMTDSQTMGKRFNLKLEYLLTPEQKRFYYSEAADLLIDSYNTLTHNTSSYITPPVNTEPPFDSKTYNQVPISAYALLTHLKSSLELEYVPQRKLAKLFGIIQEELIKQYEVCYERLVVKEVLFIAANNHESGLKVLDENEVLVDYIIRYREAFDGFLALATGQLQDMVHQMGGLRPEFYEKYTKMLILNEVCERFLQQMDQNPMDDEAAQTQLNQDLQSTQQALHSNDYFDNLSSNLKPLSTLSTSSTSTDNTTISSDDSLTFYPYLKKKWLLSRNLINPQFMQYAPAHLLTVMGNLKRQAYDPAVPVVKLRNQFFINYNVFQNVRNFIRDYSGRGSGGRSLADQGQLVGRGAQSNIGGPDSLFGQGGLMKPEMKSRGERIQDYIEQLRQQDAEASGHLTSPGQENIKLIDQLFQQDHDLKMKLASQYDMLGFVGSEIDEIKMDHLSFYKIYNQLWGGQTYNEQMAQADEIPDTKVTELLETDLSHDALLQNCEGSPNAPNGMAFLGYPLPISNANALKSLAFFSQIKKDLGGLLDEIQLQMDELIHARNTQTTTAEHPSTLMSPHLLQKVLNDVFECLDDRDSFAILLSADVSLYRKLQKAEFTLRAVQDKALNKKLNDKVAKVNAIHSIHQHSASEESKKGQIEKIDVHQVINSDDSHMYNIEQLRNFNKYYFDPYLNNTIPYREQVKESIAFQRDVITQSQQLFERIQDSQYNILINTQSSPASAATTNSANNTGEPCYLIGGSSSSNGSNTDSNNQQDNVENSQELAGISKLHLFFNYIDTFANTVLNSITMEQLQVFINNPVACNADKHFTDILNMDYTDPDLSLAYSNNSTSNAANSLLNILNVKGYNQHPTENLNMFNQMILRSGLMRSYLEELRLKEDSKRVIQDKRIDLLRTIVEQNKYHTLHSLLNQQQHSTHSQAPAETNPSTSQQTQEKTSSPTKVLHQVAVFPYSLDYLITDFSHQSSSHKQHTIVTLDNQVQKDCVESLVKEQKVKEAFSKNVHYQEIDFSHIKVEHLIQ